jgi:hypothetical protein
MQKARHRCRAFVCSDVSSGVLGALMVGSSPTMTEERAMGFRFA